MAGKLTANRRRQYARDFSELTSDDIRALANAMAKIGRAATKKARRQARIDAIQRLRQTRSAGRTALEDKP